MGIRVPSQLCFWVAQVLGLIAIILVLIWTMYFRGGLSWENDENLIFNFHPLLMLLGVIGQGGLAIMSLRALPLQRSKSYQLHLGCHAVSLLAGILGVYAAFRFHNESDHANFYSLHSWIGIGVVVLYGVQWIFGLIVFIRPGVSLGFRRSSLPWHVVHGLFLYTLAVGNAALGFLERLTLLENSTPDIKKSEVLIVNTTAIITILFGVVVVFTALGEPAEVVDDSSYSAI